MTWENTTGELTSYASSRSLGSPHPDPSATTPATNDLVTPFFAGTDATVTIPADTTGVPVGYEGNDSNQMYRMMQAKLVPPAAACADGGGLATVSATMTIRNNGPANGQGFVGGFSLVNGTTVLSGGSLPNNFARNVSVTRTVTATVPVADVAAGTIRLNLAVETYHVGSKSWTFSNFSSSYVLRCPPVPHEDAPVEIGAGPYTVDLLGNDDQDSTDTPAALDPASVQLWNPTTSTWGTSLTTADGTYAVDTTTGQVTFTPTDPNFSGAVTEPVRYRVSNTDMTAAMRTSSPGDAYGESTLTLTVTEPAVDDSAVVVPGAPVTVDVLSNDGITDVDSGTLSLVDPDTGDLVTTLTVDGGVWEVVDGQIVFTPNDDVSTTPPGPVTYVVEDGDGNPYSAVLTVTVAEPAVDDTAVVVPGTPVTVDVLGNDGITDVDTGTLRLLDPATGELVTTLTVDGGVWEVVDGQVVFTPNDGVSTTPP
ncbi:MAG: hypothetical protein QM597_00665, partial [Aeromicrobium sp.]